MLALESAWVGSAFLEAALLSGRGSWETGYPSAAIVFCPLCLGGAACACSPATLPFGRLSPTLKTCVY